MTVKVVSIALRDANVERFSRLEELTGLSAQQVLADALRLYEHVILETAKGHHVQLVIRGEVIEIKDVLGDSA